MTAAATTPDLEDFADLAGTMCQQAFLHSEIIAQPYAVVLGGVIFQLLIEAQCYLLPAAALHCVVDAAAQRFAEIELEIAQEDEAEALAAQAKRNQQEARP